MINISAAVKKFLSHHNASSRLSKGYVSKDTVRTYTHGLQQFCVHIESQGISNLEDVTRDHLTNHLAGLRQNGLSARSVALRRAILGSLFKWASQNYKHLQNVVRDVDRIRLDRQEAKHLNGGQQESLLAFLWKDKKSKKRDALIFELMLRTGLRVSEVAGLNIRSLRLSPQGVELSVLGKGNKQREILIPLIAEGEPGATEIQRFYKRLEEYLGRRRRIRPNEGNEEALFLTNYGFRIRPRNIQSAFEYCAKRLNLDGVTPHALRHTFATSSFFKEE